ncbi:DUF4270 domain-containing protein [Flavobacterium sp. S87F.05.LMB.W.Kidney.N]|uniref:DUF4270 domain-containing protein n=1 Tax=Flavobacterium sp. S87F.05.LMB.W.Kidney.N TaxID=1278758 RepID=UPI001065DEF6|nr:DUF4270 domain-containing protein [Flavobacterium sp. S87F.05.LMB.W.Kidney.N]TDX13320.1 uncharacterized protein DUF4270 [Flavobacterium sp. S87F.05.LMB.W.Kidney.N]
MYNTSFIKKILLALIVVFLYSCDKDFNAIGDGLIGDDHFGLEPEKYNVLAFNQEVTPIQSNNLAINALGIYDNPVFGTTTANFVTQLALSAYAPTIGEAPVIDSVKLAIPYFSHVKSTDTNGNNTYVLDSIYGDQNGKIKLSVYESKMQMRSSYFSGGSQLPQFYYTDQNTDFFNQKGDVLLNDAQIKDKSGNLLENDQFYFDPAEIKTKTIDPDTKKETVTRSVPQMTLHLNKDFFQTKILNAAASKLSTEDLFQEYFRGLYFNVEKSGSFPSNMALMDFSKGVITIYYKAKTASTTDGDATESKQILLNLKSSITGGIVNTASFLQDVRKPDYESAITTNVNKTDGDERLYLKGGQGALAVISLNDFGAQLETIRANKWMVNEANLVFYIDSDKMTGADEPKRVYLYDLDNNTIITDYSDGTSGALNPLDPKTTRYIYDGMINVDATTKRGKTYKIRLTNHIRNIIKDATVKNVRLGLVVTEDVSIIASNVLKLKNETISQAPRASVMNPLGTILYGGKTSIPDDKRLRLEVYYTKPN